MGRFMKWSSALSRKSSIHWGSPFMCEICSTTSRLSPFFDLKAYLSSGSWKPYLYSPMPSRIFSSLFLTDSFIGHLYARPAALPPLSFRLFLLADPIVPMLFQAEGQVRPAGLDDAPAHHHVHEVRLDVVQ